MFDKSLHVASRFLTGGVFISLFELISEVPLK
jgi:hypothetical protein